MPDIHVDPDELELFITKLTGFSNGLVDMRSRIKGQFRRLGETFQDDQFLKFEAEFVRTLSELDKVIKLSEEHIPYLKRKAKAAREFQQR